jgi:hypothetical protein
MIIDQKEQRCAGARLTHGNGRATHIDDRSFSHNRPTDYKRFPKILPSVQKKTAKGNMFSKFVDDVSRL